MPASRAARCHRRGHRRHRSDAALPAGYPAAAAAAQPAHGLPAQQAVTTPVRVAVDFVGFTIEDHFVVGYGLDLAEAYRTSYIGVMDD